MFEQKRFAGRHLETFDSQKLNIYTNVWVCFDNDVFGEQVGLAFEHVFIRI